MQKLKPQLLFNAGRVISYGIFGTLIGAIGSTFTLSSFATGMITIIASAAMIILGFQLLNLFPWMKRLTFRMPKWIAHRVHASNERAGRNPGSGKLGSFLLGAGTFFLPCGFTQALQLYVLSTGNPVTGGLTMLVFALGTLPALLSISAISSFAKGAFQRRFVQVSAVVVILLGLSSVGRGWNLTGIGANIASAFSSPSSASNASSAQGDLVPVVDGKQIVDMLIKGYSYSPSQFKVRAGIPVEWRIDGRNAAGCAQVVLVPDLNMSVILSRNEITTTTFTPQKEGSLPFRCSMGMTTPGARFTVVAKEEAVATETVVTPATTPPTASVADPSSDVQRFQTTAIDSYTFTPNTFTAIVGRPIELTVDVKQAMDGCMSVMIVNGYETGTTLRVGKDTVKFTPTHTGQVELTCPMGVEMVTFNITNP